MKPHCSIISTVHLPKYVCGQMRKKTFVSTIYAETGMIFCQRAAQGLVWSHWMQSLHQGSKVIGTAVGVSYQRPPAAVPHWKTRSFEAWLCLIGWHGEGEELYSWRPSLAESDGADGQRGGEMIQTQGQENWDTEISSLTEKELERRRVWGGKVWRHSHEKKVRGVGDWNVNRKRNPERQGCKLMRGNKKVRKSQVSKGFISSMLFFKVCTV